MLLISYNKQRQQTGYVTTQEHGILASVPNAHRDLLGRLYDANLLQKDIVTGSSYQYHKTLVHYVQNASIGCWYCYTTLCRQNIYITENSLKLFTEHFTFHVTNGFACQRPICCCAAQWRRACEHGGALLLAPLRHRRDRGKRQENKTQTRKSFTRHEHQITNKATKSARRKCCAAPHRKINNAHTPTG